MQDMLFSCTWWPSYSNLILCFVLQSMLALARLYLTVDDLDACQQQCVQLLKMDAENDAATVVSKSAVYKKTKYSKWFEPGGNMLRHVATCCNLLFPSVVLRHTSCPCTKRQYYNRSPTNPDENYNPPRTSLTPLRLYRYLTTTN